MKLGTRFGLYEIPSRFVRTNIQQSYGIHMKTLEKKLAGAAIPADEMTDGAELAITAYQERVLAETGGRVSKSRAIVAILERSEFAKAL